MIVDQKRFAGRVLKASLAAALVLAGAAIAVTACAQGQQELVREVNRAIVEVRTDRDETIGSGFVVDDKAGLVFTSFDVVCGAAKCWVTFPADRDDKRYETEGFVAVLPEKDLCLLKFVRGSKAVRGLRMAAQVPDQG
jgi:S1-C subfamily serine protease